jgi:hypothetical protein
LVLFALVPTLTAMAAAAMTPIRSMGNRVRFMRVAP